MKKFENHRVMVTAGAAGIGKAIATFFAREGALVHVVDIDRVAIGEIIEATSAQPGLLVSEADVANEFAVKTVFAKQQQTFDGVDTLVNCAGIKGPTGTVETLLLTDWQRCLEVNLQATFLCSKYAIPLLKKQGNGSIINLSSTAGWHGYPLRSPYAAAKWAVIGFTKSLAMELGPFGIRANAICPGCVNGDRMERVIAAEAAAKHLPTEQIRDAYTKSVSMRAFIEAEDIAETALFLASEAAAKISGQFISVDGHLENVGGLDQ